MSGSVARERRAALRAQKRAREIVPLTVTLAADRCDAEAIRAILEERHGRAFTFDEFAEVVDAALEVRDAEEGRRSRGRQDGHAFRTIACGGETFHSITHGARIHLFRIEDFPIPIEWEKRAGDWVNLVHGYALAHARTPEALEALSTPEQTRRLVTAWGARLSCTPAELAAVVVQLVNDGYPPVETSGKKNFRIGIRTRLRCWCRCVSSGMAARVTGFTMFLKRTFTGSCARDTAGCSSARKPPARTASQSTIPASKPRPAGANS